MAPSFTDTYISKPIRINDLVWQSTTDVSIKPHTLHSGNSYTISSDSGYDFKETKNKKTQETAKQKIKRIATERMLASWHLYNQKTITIKQLKQLCKPRHQLNFIGVRR